MKTPTSAPPPRVPSCFPRARRILMRCVAALIVVLLGIVVPGTLRAADSVPPPWVGQDIGGPGRAGGASFNSYDNSFFINGGGNDIWNGSDQFHFDHYRLRGDGVLTARLTDLANTDTWAKAGVMIRTSLDANSAYAAMLVTHGQGAAFQTRAGAGAQTTSNNTAGIGAPTWVRIQRAGNTLTGSTSSDGNNWTVRGTTSLGLGDPVYIGLAVTSHNANALTGARFVNVVAAPEQAVATDRFVDSLGVCTHWNYGNTPYGFNYANTKAALVNLGVRHYRDGLYSVAADLAASGIRGTVVADVPDYSNGSLATVQAFVNQVQSVNNGNPGSVVEAVEGPNEPDFFWSQFSKTYNGSGFPNGPLQFQRDLYATMKGNPATASLPVIGIALGATYGYGGNPFANDLLTSHVDYGNFHPYPGGNPFSAQFRYGDVDWYIGHGTQPSANIDEFPYAFDIYQPPYGQKPMVVSETGYFTGSSNNSQNQSVFAKYVPRLYLEYFRRGIARMFLYEFVDEFSDSGNNQNNRGLVYNDLTPKPAYRALKSLVDLLKEPGANFVPGNLALTYQVNPPGGYDRTQYVRRVLMQRSNGEFYLVLYHEIANSSAYTSAGAGIGGTTREINPPDISTTINLPPSVTAATRYTYDGNWNFQPTTLNVSSRQITVAVQDRVQVIKLTVNGGGGGNIPEGNYRLSPRHATGLSLDADGSTSGSRAQIYQYFGNANQKWRISPAGGGSYRLSPTHAPAQGLEVSGGPGATASGTRAQIWQYVGETNQRWLITPTDNGFYRLSPVNASGQCLEVAGGTNATANGTNAQIWTYVGATNQQWTIQAP